jgi:dolichol-phosphate mannosyltransferase
MSNSAPAVQHLMAVATTRAQNGIMAAHGWRILRFGLVGGSGVAVNMGVLALLVSMAGWPLLFAAPVATETAILNNFLLNDNWTFRDRRSGVGWLHRAWRYNSITLGGLLLSVTVLAALVHYAGLHYLIANLVAIGVGAGWNYSMNFWLTWFDRPRLSEVQA